jgi:hypothetical protein
VVYIPVRVDSSIKKNLCDLKKKWTALEIMLSKINQAQKDKYFMVCSFSHTESIPKKLTIII